MNIAAYDLRMKTKIYHRNDARPALAALKLSTRRILYLTIVQQDRDDKGHIVFNPNKRYRITAKQYSELCGVNESVAYRQLKAGVRDIRSHLMEIKESEVLSVDEIDNDSSSKDDILVFTVANYGKYSDGNGYVEIGLDPIMAPYISNLSCNFTGQFLLSGLRLPDNNTNRIYLLLREWISSGFVEYKEISFEDLKKGLLVSDSETYKVYNEFNKLFFKRSVKKLVEDTEFTKIEMEIVSRLYRKAHILKISYEYDDQKKSYRDTGLFSKKNRDVL